MVNANPGKDVTVCVTLADLLVNDNGGELVPSVVDTCAMVHLDLRITSRIFKKVRNAAIDIIRGLDEDDS